MSVFALRRRGPRADDLPVRLPHLPLFALCVGVAGLLRAASFDDRVEALFRPPLGEWIALSPEGQRVAYTTYPGGDLRIVVMNLEPPGPKRTVKLELDRDPAFAPDRPPAQLRFLPAGARGPIPTGPPSWRRSW